MVWGLTVGWEYVEGKRKHCGTTVDLFDLCRVDLGSEVITHSHDFFFFSFPATGRVRQVLSQWSPTLPVRDQEGGESLQQLLHQPAGQHLQHCHRHLRSAPPGVRNRY